MTKVGNLVKTRCEKTRQVRSTFLVEQGDGANNKQNLGKKKSQDREKTTPPQLSHGQAQNRQAGAISGRVAVDGGLPRRREQKRVSHRKGGRVCKKNRGMEMGWMTRWERMNGGRSGRQGRERVVVCVWTLCAAEVQADRQEGIARGCSVLGAVLNQTSNPYTYDE